MSDERIVFGGRQWLRVAAVAECYTIEVTLVRRACRAGLVRYVETEDGDLAVAVTDLGRVAALVRLCVYQGVALESAVLFLSLDES